MDVHEIPEFWIRCAIANTRMDIFIARELLRLQASVIHTQSKHQTAQSRCRVQSDWVVCEHQSLSPCHTNPLIATSLSYLARGRLLKLTKSLGTLYVLCSHWSLVAGNSAHVSKSNWFHLDQQSWQIHRLYPSFSSSVISSWNSSSRVNSANSWNLYGHWVTLPSSCIEG